MRIPADYVADSLELAYAAAYLAQGATVDTAHALVTPEMTREALYVASTRGRASTHWYAVTEQPLDATNDHEPDPSSSATDVLASVLARTRRRELGYRDHHRHRCPSTWTAQPGRSLPARLGPRRT